ncbi:hypothetical protein ACSLVQ_29880, partial [Klebsiella pneumoniae]|uniref:hypothetical protein n=1 Tax=Klebsiella pneumoniae TaxID=573 RepID=UPI003EE0C978
MMALLMISTAVLTPKDAIAGGTIFNVLRTLAGTVGSAVMSGILTVRERVHSAIIISSLSDGAPKTVAAQ